MKQIVKVGLLTVLLGSAIALPVQETEAATRCREVIRHGVVVERTCTREPDYYHRGYRDRDYRHQGYRTVCKTYWRHGVKHRDCRKVRVDRYRR
jgi:hypothetical protein